MLISQIYVGLKVKKKHIPGSYTVVAKGVISGWVWVEREGYESLIHINELRHSSDCGDYNLLDDELDECYDCQKPIIGFAENVPKSPPPPPPPVPFTADFKELELPEIKTHLSFRRTSYINRYETD